MTTSALTGIHFISMWLKAVEKDDVTWPVQALIVLISVTFLSHQSPTHHYISAKTFRFWNNPRCAALAWIISLSYVSHSSLLVIEMFSRKRSFLGPGGISFPWHWPFIQYTTKTGSQPAKGASCIEQSGDETARHEDDNVREETQTREIAGNVTVYVIFSCHNENVYFQPWQTRASFRFWQWCHFTARIRKTTVLLMVVGKLFRRLLFVKLHRKSSN